MTSEQVARLETLPLGSIPPDSVVYTTKRGAAVHGDSRELLARLPEGSVDLIVTSPPFALAP